MRVEEFVRLFKETGDKERFCEKHIVKKYMPFINKLAECNRVVQSTMSVLSEDGVPIFNQKTPARFLIFHMTLLKYYTDLEIDEKSDEHTFIDDYDALNEIGAFDLLISKLPEHEYKEFSTILSMTVDDYLANNRTMISYLDNLMGLLSTNELKGNDQE